MLQTYLISIPPSTLFFIHSKDNSSTKNSSPKISCHSLMFTYSDTLKGLFLPRLRCSSIFSCLHFLAPCLPISTFPSCFPFITPLRVLPPSHLCVCLLSCSPNVVFFLLHAAVSLLLPPPASSAKLCAAALLWCLIHF